MRTSAETARHARIRRAVGLVLAVAGRPSRVRLVVAMLAVVSLLSAGGALQHASARSPESLSERDTVKPSAPELLRVTDTAESSLTLAWSASSDDVGVAGYEVRRSDSRRAERVTTTTYLLVNLMCG